MVMCYCYFFDDYLVIVLTLTCLTDYTLLKAMFLYIYYVALYLCCNYSTHFYEDFCLFADLPTIFLKFEYVRSHHKPQVTKFVNCHAWLPMGTIHKFERHGNDNPRLYAYGHPNVSPPTEMVRHLLLPNNAYFLL